MSLKNHSLAVSLFFSIKGICIAGAIIHNTGQMAIASWLLHEAR